MSLPTSSRRPRQSPKSRSKRPSKLETQLSEQLRDLRLPMFCEHFQNLARKAQTEAWTYPEYLAELTNLECEARQQSRIERLLKNSKLPETKRWDNFDWKRLPLNATRQLESLRNGSFLDRRENILVFGPCGSGKTHCLAALGEQLARQGRSVLFTTCNLLVQQLLIAKRDLRLARELKRLSRFEGLIIDDLGYVEQSRQEMEVLFTLLAERYERGSVLLTSNLPFSKWEKIFKDAMTAAAAIDRLVHHSVIIELNLPSYRLEAAQTSQKKTKTGEPNKNNKPQSPDSRREI